MRKFITAKADIEWKSIQKITNSWKHLSQDGITGRGGRGSHPNIFIFLWLCWLVVNNFSKLLYSATKYAIDFSFAIKTLKTLQNFRKCICWVCQSIEKAFAVFTFHKENQPQKKKTRFQRIWCIECHKHNQTLKFCHKKHLELGLLLLFFYCFFDFLSATQK